MSLPLLFIITAFLMLAGRIINIGQEKLNQRFNAEYIKYGFLSRFYLSEKLTPSKFEDWCKIILEDMNCKNLNNVTELFEGGVNLSSLQNSECTYISTRLYRLKDSKKENVSDNYETVGRPEVQKFIGALVQDKVKKGIIITTGGFTNEAKEYLETLPPEYSITLIDGIELTKRLRRIRKKEIAARLGTVVQERC